MVSFLLFPPREWFIPEVKKAPFLREKACIVDDPANTASRTGLLSTRSEVGGVHTVGGREGTPRDGGQGGIYTREEGIPPW